MICVEFLIAKSQILWSISLRKTIRFYNATESAIFWLWEPAWLTKQLCDVFSQAQDIEFCLSLETFYLFLLPQTETPANPFFSGKLVPLFYQTLFCNAPVLFNQRLRKDLQSVHWSSVGLYSWVPTWMRSREQ